MTNPRARALVAFSSSLAVSLALPMPHATGLAQTATPKSRPGKAATEQGFSLAFVDADVRRVVDAVLGSMLEVEYSVDPAVQGNITLRTRQPVPRSQLVPLLEQALRSVNAVVLAQGSTYRVVALEQARTRPPVAATGTSGGAEDVPGFASQVITLKYASAREIARLIEEFLGKEVVSSTNAAYNQIVITGTAEERTAARELIARFDIDALKAMSFETYRLENVDPETVAAELTRIFQPPFDIIGTRVRLVPLPRLRSLIAIAMDRADIARIDPWVRRLDAGGSGKRKLYSYAVQYGRARDLATSLQLVLGVSLGTGASNSSPAAGLSAAAPAMIESGEAAPSAVIAPQTPLPGGGSPIFAGGEGPRIVPIEETNSILVYANGEEYEFIREALAKLDQPVAQVLIEATLAEVTLTDDLRYGINFRLFGDNNMTVVNSSTGSAAPAVILPGYSASYAGSAAQAVLNTLQSKTHVRVLSAPKLVVLNNQTATLQVGDQVPIITAQSQSVAAPGAPLVNNVEMRDTGVILKVTPRVNDQGVITLDIAQEVSDVTETTSSGINSPTIQQRRIASTVMTRSGQMIALGGLIRDRSIKGRSGIPGLSQLPVIGGLFGTYNDAGARTELIILLTPTVIRSPDEVRGVVDALIDGLDRTRPLIDRAIKAQVNAPPKAQ